MPPLQTSNKEKIAFPDGGGNIDSLGFIKKHYKKYDAVEFTKLLDRLPFDKNLVALILRGFPNILYQ